MKSDDVITWLMGRLAPLLEDLNVDDAYQTIKDIKRIDELLVVIDGVLGVKDE